jgi:RNA-directed DNA polymerase
LEGLCREPALRRLLGVILAHPIPGQLPGKGLPIGNLTSQWFANFYLDELDHWIKEVRGLPGYLRYMDDLACWADDKATLFTLATDLREFLNQRLGLMLKEERTLIAPVSEGMPLLGWRVYPGLLRQQGRRLHRQRRLLKRREAEFQRGEISAEQLQDCVRALAGPRRFLGHGEPVRSEIDV